MTTKTYLRETERKGCLVPVDSETGAFDRMRSVDISRKGLGLIANHPMAIGQSVAVKVDLSAQGDSVVVWGKVRWVQRIPESGNYRVGISFTQDTLDGSARDIERYFKAVGS